MEHFCIVTNKSKDKDLEMTMHIKEYLEKLYYGFAEYIPEERNVIFKMLEHWAFLADRYKDREKELKAIRKSRSKGEYFAAVNNLFSK